MSLSLDVNPLREGLTRERAVDPCIFVIFGGTGDLAHRKLLPALYRLHRSDLLPRGFAIVSYANESLTDESYRETVRGSIAAAGSYLPTTGSDWDTFAEHIYFVSRGENNNSGLLDLKNRLAELDPRIGTEGNYLFYFAIPPAAFASAARDLGYVGLAKDQSGHGWRRLVVEKPFGTDLESARELNRVLLSSFSEDQIYRIDHYLGKETVQNILVFRFANEFVEPLLNARYVDSVQITVAESIGIESRGAFYDRTGALRDIVQNHVLQILSLVCMEPPVSLDADAVRDEKMKVFAGIRKMEPHQVEDYTVRGQYTGGMLLGEKARSYREERDVDPDSTTETFIAAKFYVDNWRWAGVPFYVRTGKRLAKRVTEIGIQLKTVPKILFGESHRDEITPNVIALNIQPDEGISMIFQAKVPGLDYRIQPVKMDFAYESAFGESAPDAYERLLMDAMLGDAGLFSRADSLEATWEVVQPILDGWRIKNTSAYPYLPGSWGPRESSDLIRRDGRGWRRL
ncbi:MAG: glucose-6-phosphate dehydrogenase [Armatimonadetes bacterium]|jgi:glucose-6-phosphate 1-dehydrogenase|nr:glucose-6-phosphate dehydrogenase [Armatimonadota bacterium]